MINNIHQSGKYFIMGDMSEEMEQMCVQRYTENVNQDPVLQDCNNKTLLPSIYRFKVVSIIYRLYPCVIIF